MEDRQKVFNAFHGLAHAGTRATGRLIAARAMWRGMNFDLAAWVRDCQACCRGKVTAQPAAPVQSIAVLAKRFSHVHFDLVGPLPVVADSSTYLLTMVDRTTRWLEAAPSCTMEAAVCTDAFIATWVTRFGVPATVTTDRGRQFSSAVLSTLCQLNIQHMETTAYHPQSNGMVERTHCQLKDALRARLAGPRWPEHLPWVLFGLRAAPKDDSGLSSAELVLGMPLTLPRTARGGGGRKGWRRRVVAGVYIAEACSVPGLHYTGLSCFWTCLQLDVSTVLHRGLSCS